VFGEGAAFTALPCCAQLASILGPDVFLDALGVGLKEVVPCAGRVTFNDTMGFAAEADGTAGEGRIGWVWKGALFLFLVLYFS